MYIAKRRKLPQCLLPASALWLRGRRCRMSRCLRQSYVRVLITGLWSVEQLATWTRTETPRALRIRGICWSKLGARPNLHRFGLIFPVPAKPERGDSPGYRRENVVSVRGTGKRGTILDHRGPSAYICALACDSCLLPSPSSSSSSSPPVNLSLLLSPSDAMNLLLDPRRRLSVRRTSDRAGERRSPDLHLPRNLSRPSTTLLAVLLGLLALSCTSILPAHAFVQDPARYVDSFIGTINGGHVFAGASRPHGSVKSVADVHGGDNQGGFAGTATRSKASARCTTRGPAARRAWATTRRCR